MNNSIKNSNELNDRLNIDDELFLPYDHANDWDALHSNLKNKSVELDKNGIASKLLLKMDEDIQSVAFETDKKNQDSRNQPIRNLAGSDLTGTVEEVAESYLLKLSGRLDEHYGRETATQILENHSKNETRQLNLGNLNLELSVTLNSDDYRKIFPNEEIDDFNVASAVYGPSIEDRLLDDNIGTRDNLTPSVSKPGLDDIDQVVDGLSAVRNKYGQEIRDNLYNAHLDENGGVNFKELNSSIKFMLDPDGADRRGLRAGGVPADEQSTPSISTGDQNEPDFYSQAYLKQVYSKAQNILGPEVFSKLLPEQENGRALEIQDVYHHLKDNLTPDQTNEIFQNNQKVIKMEDNGKVEKKVTFKNKEGAEASVLEELRVRLPQWQAKGEQNETPQIGRTRTIIGGASKSNSSEHPTPSDNNVGPAFILGQSARDPKSKGGKEWTNSNPDNESNDEATVKRSNVASTHAIPTPDSESANKQAKRANDVPLSIAVPSKSAQSQSTSRPTSSEPSPEQGGSGKTQPSLYSQVTAGLSATATGVAKGAQGLYNYFNQVQPALVEPQPKKIEVPAYARMETKRTFDLEANKGAFSEVNRNAPEAKTAEIGKLHIPGIFKGTQTVGEDNSVTFERQVLGGRYKSKTVFENKDGEMIKTFQEKSNARGSITKEITTNENGEVIRNETRKNARGNIAEAFEFNASGKLLTQKSSLAYKMHVQAHPQAELNPDVRQKATAVLGLFKGTYDVDANNKATQTGRSNPLFSNESEKIAGGGTKNRQTDLGGLLSRTVEKTTDGTEFVTKDRVRGLYKMQSNQAQGADENGKGGVDAKTTLEAGFLGFKAFKREVVIPHDSDMKTTSLKVFGVTVSKQITALTPDEVTLRNQQTGADKPKIDLPASEKTKSNLEYVREAVRGVYDFVRANPVQTAAAGVSAAAAAIAPSPITVGYAAVNAAGIANSYNNRENISAQHDIPKTVTIPSIGENTSKPSASPISSLDDSNTTFGGNPVWRGAVDVATFATEKVREGFSAVSNSIVQKFPSTRPGRDSTERTSGAVSI
jgi:hypothetical protein